MSRLHENNADGKESHLPFPLKFPGMFFGLALLIGPPTGGIIICFFALLSGGSRDSGGMILVIIALSYVFGLVPAFISAIILFVVFKTVKLKSMLIATMLALICGLLGTFLTVLFPHLVAKGTKLTLSSQDAGFLALLTVLGGLSSMVCFRIGERLARLRQARRARLLSEEARQTGE